MDRIDLDNHSLPSAKEIEEIIKRDGKKLRESADLKNIKNAPNTFPNNHANSTVSTKRKKSLVNFLSTESIEEMHNGNRSTLGQKDSVDSRTKLLENSTTNNNQTKSDVNIEDLDKTGVEFQTPILIEKKDNYTIVTYEDGSKASNNRIFALLSEHLVTSGQIFTCNICSEMRTNKHSFQRHLSSHAMPTPCPQCGKLLKSFGRPDVLKRHLLVCKSIRMHSQ